MTKRKFTVDEVIKALEHCTSSTTSEACNGCPFNQTNICEQMSNGVEIYALDLINRQRAEIADLEDENKGLKETNEHLSGEYIALSKENDKMRKIVNADVVIVNRRGGKSEYAKEIIRIKTSLVKTDAIKEFAERLKARAYQSTEWSHGDHPMVVEVDDIDELVEEMVEGEKNSE